MSYSAMKWARQQVLPASEKFVLFVMADYAREGDDVAFPALQTLVSDTGMSERTIQRARKNLVKLGLIVKEPRYGQSGFRLIFSASIDAKPDTATTKGDNLSPKPDTVSPPRHSVAPPDTVSPQNDTVSPPPNHQLTTNKPPYPSGQSQAHADPIPAAEIIPFTAAGARSPQRQEARSARAVLFSDGVRIVSHLTGKPDRAARGLLGKWAKAARDDVAGLNALLAEAWEMQPVDPIAWLEKAVQHRFSKGWSQIDRNFGINERQGLDEMVAGVENW